MVLGNNEEFMILRYLIENSTESYSIRSISKIRDINYKSAYENIAKLQKREVIYVDRLGNSKICGFSHGFDELVYSVERVRLLDTLKNKDLRAIHRHLQGIDKPFILLLFGSYAKGKQTKSSDMDFLLVAEDSAEIESSLGILPIEIHLTRISYGEFSRMLKSREFNVVNEAFKRNVIFFGAEDYYRIVRNANRIKDKAGKE